MDISSLIIDPVLIQESCAQLYYLIQLDYLNSIDINEHAIEKMVWREEFIMENEQD